MLAWKCFRVQLSSYIIFFDLIRILLYIFIQRLCHFADAEVQTFALPSTGIKQILYQPQLPLQYTWATPFCTTYLLLNNRKEGIEGGGEGSEHSQIIAPPVP